MTTLALSSAPAGLSSSRIVKFVGRLSRSFWAWNEGRKTRDSLSKLSDHELEDIGLVRGDIDELAYKSRLYL